MRRIPRTSPTKQRLKSSQRLSQRPLSFQAWMPEALVRTHTSMMRPKVCSQLRYCLCLSSARRTSDILYRYLKSFKNCWHLKKVCVVVTNSKPSWKSYHPSIKPSGSPEQPLILRNKAWHQLCQQRCHD